MPFTEFYIQASGDNRNAGSTSSYAPTYQAIAGTWDTTSGRYTPNSGNPTSLVNVGDFASLYINTSGEAQSVHRVLAVDASGYDLSLTFKSGPTPNTSSGNIASRVGGAWSGPGGVTRFPWYKIGGLALRDIANRPCRFNFKNDKVYNLSSSIPVSTPQSTSATFTVWQGYTNTPGDSGKATLDGGVAGTSYALLDFTGSYNTYADFIFQNNGATGKACGVKWQGNGTKFLRCVFANFTGNGFEAAGTNSYCIDCEAVNNGETGFFNTGSGGFVKCVSYDNQGSGNGFSNSNALTVFYSCIASNNGGNGFLTATANGFQYLQNCDAYNNRENGFFLASSAFTNQQLYVLLNSHSFKNNKFGILCGSGFSVMRIAHCVFGDGSEGNISGTIGYLNQTNCCVLDENNFTYPINEHPWQNPSRGNFNLVHPLSKGRGNGVFLQTMDGQDKIISYPDIGAVGHKPIEPHEVIRPTLTTINASNPIRDAGATINGIPRL